ncbi:Hypothetical_protein [Hexamita inflata]|uniref:Hypothetical_protein n=1 Tax=Hexamita inflata TaxID=28002 RepID=A0ABP1HIB0_9EUKA
MYLSIKIVKYISIEFAFQTISSYLNNQLIFSHQVPPVDQIQNNERSENGRHRERELFRPVVFNLFYFFFAVDFVQGVYNSLCVRGRFRYFSDQKRAVGYFELLKGEFVLLEGLGGVQFEQIGGLGGYFQLQVRFGVDLNVFENLNKLSYLTQYQFC